MPEELCICDPVRVKASGRTGVIQRIDHDGRCVVYMDDNGAMLDFPAADLEIV